MIWLDAIDCDPPHRLDMTSPRNANKVNTLADAFEKDGFDLDYPALVGYVLNGRVQLLSGSHRHRAALLTNTKLPVTLWLGSDVERYWGDLTLWKEVMADIPARENP